MLIRFDIQLQSRLVGSKENEICDALSRGCMGKYNIALNEWKARGGSTDTYKCPLDLVDVIPDTPPTEE